MPNIPGPNPVNPAPPGPKTLRDIITYALIHINAVSPGEPIDPSEMDFSRNIFNQIVDSWMTQKVMLYASSLVSSYTDQATGTTTAFLLTPGLSPHRIGPTAVAPAATPQFIVPNERPVRIRNANVILQNVNPTVRTPLTMRDNDWWAKQSVQTIQTQLPTDLYYSADWPAGSLFFWPVPNFAYQVEFEIETIIQGGADLNAVFASPPGYELALSLTLAELLSVPFGKNPAQLLIQAAAKARMAIMGPNSRAPRIDLNDFGAPSGQRPRASFNYRTGLDR